MGRFQIGDRALPASGLQAAVAQRARRMRLETPARPSSVPDEDSMPRFMQVFKNKAPLACASGALFLNTGGGGVYRTILMEPHGYWAFVTIS